MSSFAGAGRLARLAARRDRFWIAAYVLGLTAFLGVTTALFVSGPRSTVTDGTRVFATNAAVRVMGLASGDSVGAYAILRDYLLLAVLAALISTLTVIRHTRQDEETGRAELLGAGAIGRYAALSAALIVTVCANVALAATLAGVLIANGLPAGGSVAAGISIALAGITFTGVAAVTAQLSSTTRGATGLAAAVLGVSFLVAGLGNMLGSPDPAGLRVTPSWLTWLSPLGWGELIRPFGGDHPAPILLALGVFAALAAGAAALGSRRDLGAGILADRRGRAEASPGLTRPLGLVWRLERGALLGWAVGIAGFAAMFGAMARNVESVGGESARWYMRVGGSDQILDAYRTTTVEMAGAAVAVYVVQMLLRMHADEADGTLEPVMATAVTRARWMAGHLANAAAGAAVLLTIFAAVTALTMTVELGDARGQFGAIFQTTAVQIPAILLVAGVVVAATAFLPRWAAPVCWIYAGVTIVAGPIFGSALQLPSLVQDVSPFTLIPKLPAAGFDAMAVAGLTCLAVALIVIGVAEFRTRDLRLPV